jgi:aminoglycoside 3-N-acetyltransferase
LKVAITLETIKPGLVKLGLNEGDVVLVHSDLRTLAPARELVKLPHCGADLVIDAFLGTVGREGLVIFPTFTKTYDQGQPVYTGLVFDPHETPSRVGSITNLFWRRPDAIRGTHPTHSVAAIGGRAAEFCREPQDSTTFDRRGPWGRMFDRDGYICWFGTDNRTNTTVHAVEDWMDLPYMPDRFAWARGPDGEPTKVLCRKAPVGPRDFYRKDSKAQKVLDASGILRRIHIGQAQVTLMKVRDCHRVLREALLADPCLLLKEESPDDPWTNEARARAIEHVRDRLRQIR